MSIRVSGAALAAASLALSAVPALAADGNAADAAVIAATKHELARKIVDRGYPKAEREALLFRSVDQMVAQMRQASMPGAGAMDQGAQAIIDRWLDKYVRETKGVLRAHVPALMEGLTRAYTNLFTEQELRDILAFISTPSGERFFRLSPTILSDPNFAEANQAYMREVMSRLPAAREELQKDLRDYFLNKRAERPARN